MNGEMGRNWLRPSSMKDPGSSLNRFNSSKVIKAYHITYQITNCKV